MRIGYARVSGLQQDLEVQLAQLEAAGCEFIYREKKTGTNDSRPQLQKMMKTLRPGDVLVVCKLDRMARNTADLLALVKRITDAGAQFVSLAERWADTTSPAGTLTITIFAGFAQFEVERMKERCAEGIQAAKARGVRFGRKPALSETQQAFARQALAKGTATSHIAEVLGVSVRTIYRFKRWVLNRVEAV